MGLFELLTFTVYQTKILQPHFCLYDNIPHFLKFIFVILSVSQ